MLESKAIVIFLYLYTLELHQCTPNVHPELQEAKVAPNKMYPELHEKVATIPLRDSSFEGKLRL